MVDKQNRGFDLSAIMRLDLLEVRKIAQKNLFLTVGEYFALLYRFKNEGLGASEALREISSKRNNNEHIHTVQSIRELLEEIGCKKWSLILGEIISAILKDNFDLSADCARSVLEPFTVLYYQIIDTEIKNVGADFYTMVEPANAVDASLSSTQTLIKYLDRLELEEHDRKLQILVVDDSPTAIHAVFTTLSSDYRVYGMTDPMKIENFLQKVTPELFLLDYKMPGRSGFELIPIIRSFQEHKTTPIIILTAMGSIDHISASHSLGACDFIVKPFQVNILRKKIARHIKKKKLR